MNEVTAEQCKAVVNETGMRWLGHHKCFGCGAMVGHHFRKASDIFVDPGLEGLKPDDLVVGFDPACDCGRGSHAIRRRTWDDFAHDFNMQTPEVRAAMWERFKAGKATHELD